MTAAVERIKEEMWNLPKEELKDLLRDIQPEYAFPPLLEDDENGVQAHWDEEIGRRAEPLLFNIRVSSARRVNLKRRFGEQYIACMIWHQQAVSWPSLMRSEGRINGGAALGK